MAPGLGKGRPAHDQQRVQRRGLCSLVGLAGRVGLAVQRLQDVLQPHGEAHRAQRPAEVAQQPVVAPT